MTQARFTLAPLPTPTCSFCLDAPSTGKVCAMEMCDACKAMRPSERVKVWQRAVKARMDRKS